MTQPQYVTLAECKQCSQFLGINGARMKWDHKLRNEESKRERILLWYSCELLDYSKPRGDYPGSGNRIDIYRHWSTDRIRSVLFGSPIYCRKKTDVFNAVPQQIDIFDLIYGRDSNGQSA
jgi:hypothetical protein